MLLAVCHSDADGWTKVEDLSKLSELRERTGNVLWAEASVDSLTKEDVSLIAEEFSLHALAVEDAMSPRQRPKFEPYDTHYFIVMHQLDEVNRQLEATQIACFVGKQYVLVVHAGADRVLDEAKERWSNKLDQSHPSHLIHTLLDAVVDDYEITANRLEDEVEGLEERLLDEPTAPIQRQLYSVKQRLARMRRYVFPGTRLLDWVADPTKEHPFTAETAKLFRDVDDHLQRIKDQISNLDDLSEALLDLTRSEQAAMLNEQNRTFAAWAAIFAVGTLIAGVYGMNFALVPDEGSLGGFWFAVGLMVASGVGLFLYFRHRKWL